MSMTIPSCTPILSGPTASTGNVGGGFGYFDVHGDEISQSEMGYGYANVPPPPIGRRYPLGLCSLEIVGMVMEMEIVQVVQDLQG